MIYLAHGASGTAASMRPHVEGLQRRGLEARAVELPKRRAEAVVPVYRAAIEGAVEPIVGGHSYGGRVASLLAAEDPVAGLVLFSYPLHRPGHLEWQPRTEHWPAVRCPTLVLSGEADPFARLELLRVAVERLPDAELVTYPRIGHGLGRVLDEALDRVAEFARRVARAAR